MHFLLINNNIAVSKLVNISMKCMGYKFVEVSSYEDIPLNSYLAIFLDSAMYKQEQIEDLRILSISSSVVLLKEKDTNLDYDFLYVLEKPFLPTDFINLIINLIDNSPELNMQSKTLEEYLNNAPLNFAANNEPKNEEYINHEEIYVSNNFNDDMQKESIFDFVSKHNKDKNREIFKIEHLGEDDILEALKALPTKKIAPFELVRGELESAISKSISTSLQSQVLRDALKGLKMNITITFEDN